MLKIRYGVEAMELKQDKLEQATHTGVLENINNNQEEIMSDQYNFFELLLIANENKSFKKKAIS